MSCAFSREQLALHLEGDLSGAAAAAAAHHLAWCGDCRRFMEQLHGRQSLLKSLRRERVSASQCTGMRREVMSIINDRRDRGGWALRMERTIALGFRRRSYALAAVAVLGIVSVSMLGQLLHSAPGTKPSSAVFEGRDTLLRPEGYRDWIEVGPSSAPHGSTADRGEAGRAGTPASRVYINPSGYQEYARTGRFPEGTLMVWESLSRAPEAAGRSYGSPPNRPHETSPVLLASVKDSARFDGGWGFFDFTGLDGGVRSKAQALVESSGCRTCHRRDAETDHVFTQVYPILRSARQGAQLAVPPERAILSASLTPRLAWSRSLLRQSALPTCA